MAKCSISGQTVISGYYGLYVAPDDTHHFFAMESPSDLMGTVATYPVSIRDVADYIEALEVTPNEEGSGYGVLRWNPNEIRWEGQLLKFLTPVRVNLTSGEDVLGQLMAGGSTRVRRFVDIDGQTISVEVSQFIPPLLFKDVLAEQRERAAN